MDAILSQNCFQFIYHMCKIEAIGTAFITRTLINGNSIQVKNLTKNLSQSK